MSNPSHTPKRVFRADDDLWDPAAAKAERHGRTMSDILREAMAQWIQPAKVALGDRVQLVRAGADPVLYEVVEEPVDGVGGRTVPTLRRVED